MCTDIEYMELIQEYNTVYSELSELVAKKDNLAKLNIAENDKRNETADAKSRDRFMGVKVITERLNENATQAGRQVLKDLFPDHVDDYINVTLSRFVNSRALKKIGGAINV